MPSTSDAHSDFISNTREAVLIIRVLALQRRSDVKRAKEFKSNPASARHTAVDATERSPMADLVSQDGSSNGA